MDKYQVIFYQLTRPVSYLLLKHPAGKVYNWIVPMLFALVSIFCLYVGVGIEGIVGVNGLIAQVSDFVVSLPGFFIAALAAIATFNRPVIDQEMINAPTIDIKVDQATLSDQPLTRRDFLLRLFSFLTVESIFLTIYAKVGSLVSVPQFLDTSLQVVDWIYVSIYLVFFWQLIILLLFGMYYLCERLNLNL